MNIKNNISNILSALIITALMLSTSPVQAAATTIILDGSVATLAGATGTEVAVSLSTLTIIKEATPEDGTDFDFTINGPLAWTDNTPSGTWEAISFYTKIGGKYYFEFVDSSSYNSHLYELDGTTWTDITPTGTWSYLRFLTDFGGKSYFSFEL